MLLGVFITAVGPLLPYLLPSNRLIILYSYHYTYHVLLVITILLLVGGYMLQKHVVYVYTGPNLSLIHI